MQRNDATLDAREVVAVFDSAEALQDAIDDLLMSGFNQAALSLLASEAAADRKLGHRKLKIPDVSDDPNAPRQPYISPEDRGGLMGAMIGVPMYLGGIVAIGAIVATGGTVVAAIAGAAAAGGTGLLIGAILAKRFGDAHAHRIQEQLNQGGLLLWVRAQDQEHEDRAVSILKRQGGRDIHAHSV